MASSRPVQLGVVGSCGRGGAFRKSCNVLDDLHIAAVCDTNEQKLEQSRADLGADQAFADYQQMLDITDLDAVLIGTPMPLHAPQAIEALQRGIHVLSEVPAAISIEQCCSLVAAVHNSQAIYMMAENCVYLRSTQIIKELIRQGMFGQPYYAEGEYLHELKQLNEVTKWRRQWQTGINGITYGTHSLGPILYWMQGDRVASVCCRGSGHHHQDPRNQDYENEDSCVMLAKMVSGSLVQIRVDMLSDRPHGTNNYHLQGTDGCFESARTPDQCHRLWLRQIDPDKQKWVDLETLAGDYLPPVWKRYERLSAAAGHSGTDLLVLVAFLSAVRGESTAEIGIHEAMDMTLPGLISQQSIEQDGVWLEVPDSRMW